MAVSIKRIGASTVKLDLENLEQLKSSLMSKMVTRVGILGDKNSRKETSTTRAGYHKKGKKDSVMSNADIGMIHEYGSLSRGIPRRSFLLMPLQQKVEGLVAARNFLWNRFINGDRSVASLKQAYVLLGIHAENIIQKAFMTGGFGKWPKLTQQTIDRKKSSAILIDTAQLRRSVDSRVVTK